MPATLIESTENGRIAYDSLLVSDPTLLSAFNNKLSLRIIKVLSDNPACALDIARKLKVHEQKIYYHLKSLEKTGIIYVISNERRHGMIAKIYSVVSPVISAKLFEGGSEIKERVYSTVPSQALLNFFHPFIENGKINAKIVVGDPQPHGKYDVGGAESVHILDLLLFLGKYLDDFNFPNYRLDTEITKEELQNNLILIGNSRTNTIIDKIGDKLPIQFDPEKLSLTSSRTKVTYKDERIGVIVKTANPFNPKKMILLIGGVKTVGITSSVICILKYHENKFKNIKNNDEILIISQGLDQDGDKIIDEIKILEG
jgi:DNA-binding transcriptional ArsR family regulator